MDAQAVNVVQGDSILRFAADEPESGQRLDVWLAGKSGFSRARVQALIRAGAVQAGDAAGQLVAKSSVVGGRVYVVHVPAPIAADPKPQPIDLDIVYEDADLLVLNKPAGMVVHPAAGHADGTLVNALLHHCQDLQGIGGTRRPGIVHRLDKDTSGLLVVAKHEKALQGLADQFKSRTVQKMYLAITAGLPVPVAGRIETQIGRSRHDRKRMSTQPASIGRLAVSHYKVLESCHSFAFVEVHIETGRTHQIRVHLAHIGCPIAGDLVYGASRKNMWLPFQPDLRQMLHAACIQFRHPMKGQEMDFTVPVPQDMHAFGQDCGLTLVC